MLHGIGRHPKLRSDLGVRLATVARCQHRPRLVGSVLAREPPNPRGHRLLIWVWRQSPTEVRGPIDRGRKLAEVEGFCQEVARAATPSSRRFSNIAGPADNDGVRRLVEPRSMTNHAASVLTIEAKIDEEKIIVPLREAAHRISDAARAIDFDVAAASKGCEPKVAKQSVVVD